MSKDKRLTEPEKMVAGAWEDKHLLTNHLRDSLATLKWRIFESVGV